ncbi:MAG TPA: BlaI/MecI/CopY family transcriptional regulator [Cyclobacteriaceae bacterium]|jgi:predicted transcriptional regulator|nr:BlaI/MecI/CopY family transcriptional regulator [Cyclobacteriaceae bacterium]
MLSKTEEQLMELIWKHKKVFMKELIDLWPGPKPAPTTVATLLKRMQDKGFVGYRTFGNSREYYPLVKKKDHFSKHVKTIIKDYFENSPIQFASFFTTETNLSTAELRELRKIIDLELKKKLK